MTKQGPKETRHSLRALGQRVRPKKKEGKIIQHAASPKSESSAHRRKDLAGQTKPPYAVPLAAFC